MLAQNNLSKSSNALSDNLSRLSSGLRVRSAADDAAGLAISEDFKAKIRGLGQAKRNANDGVSLAQTADGALKEIGGMLGRMRELAVQSATGTINTTQRTYLDDEFGQLKSEIDRLATTTEFNGINLLNGASSTSPVDFQVGTGNSADDRLTLTIATATTSALAVNDNGVSTADKALSSISALDAAISAVSSRRGTIGSMSNRLSVTISNLSTYATNLSAANSRVVDVDIASETAKLTKNQILTQAGAAMLAQANQAPQIALSLLG
jgi:flagellin